VDAGGGGGGGGVCDTCPCTGGDADCRDPARPRCSPTTKLCVECLQTPTDTCPAGSYCNDLAQCTLGCKAESDCQISPGSPRCNTTRHQCVQCIDNAQCATITPGSVCSPSGTCVEGCDVAAGRNCAAGKECCQGFCLDIRADVLNCGACGTACSATNGTPRCSNGACAWTCASGFAHCNGTQNSGCETNTRTDATKCGSCTRNCNNDVQNANVPACNAGSCVFASCKAGFGNCDNNAGNGCECACGQDGQQCCPGNLCSGNLRCLPSGKCN
jgi:hypothetical protein